MNSHPGYTLLLGWGKPRPWLWPCPIEGTTGAAGSSSPLIGPPICSQGPRDCVSPKIKRLENPAFSPSSQEGGQLLHAETGSVGRSGASGLLSPKAPPSLHSGLGSVLLNTAHLLMGGARKQSSCNNAYFSGHQRESPLCKGQAWGT